MVSIEEIRKGNWLYDNARGAPHLITGFRVYNEPDLDNIEMRLLYGKYKGTSRGELVSTEQDFTPIVITEDVLGKIKGISRRGDTEYVTNYWIEGLKPPIVWWKRAKIIELSHGRRPKKNELHWFQNYIFFNYGVELQIDL